MDPHSLGLSPTTSSLPPPPLLFSNNNVVIIKQYQNTGLFINNNLTQASTSASRAADPRQFGDGSLIILLHGAAEWCPNVSNAVVWPSCITLPEALAMSFFVLIGMLVIVLGNLMVVLTVSNDAKMRGQRQNWLLVSLAMADLLVGLLVMPLTLTYEIVGVWVLGSVLCELWLALDVLFVTASILHICIISLDRYWSVTQPLSYPAKRTPRRISVMIGVAWLVSLLICFPPLLGWRPKRRPGECSVSSELDYVLYSSLGSFYIPVAILVVVYMRIYMITKRHSQQRLKDTQRMGQTLSQLSGGNKPMTAHRVAEAGAGIGRTKRQIKFCKSIPLSADEVSSPDPSTSMWPTPTAGGREQQQQNNVVDSKTLSNGGPHVQHQQQQQNNVNNRSTKEQSNDDSNESGTTTMAFDEEHWAAEHDGNECRKQNKRNHFLKQPNKTGAVPSPRFTLLARLFRKGCTDDSTVQVVRMRSLEKRKRRLKAKERQATLLLGLILFAFIASWMPFFIMYVLNALHIYAPVVVFKFFFWLGYCNSAINPIIYTYFNREFRRALLRLIRRHQHRFHFLERFSHR